MDQSGYLIVRTFISKAQLPVSDATAVIYTLSEDGQKILHSIRVTNESGIAGPIELPATASMGLRPNSPTPYINYQLLVEHPNYQLAIFNDVQIFSGVQTIQNVSLIPLSLPESGDSNTTTVTPQPL